MRSIFFYSGRSQTSRRESVFNFGEGRTVLVGDNFLLGEKDRE